MSSALASSYMSNAYSGYQQGYDSSATNTIYDPIDLTKADLDSSDVEIYGQVVHISYDLPH